MTSYLLIARFDIAFNHDAFHKSSDVQRMDAAVKHFFYDADLFLVLLVGVGVVRVHDAGRIFQIALGVHVAEEPEIFIVIIGLALTMLVDGSAQNRMGVGIAVRMHFPAPENEGVPVLSCHDGIQHNRKIAAGGVFHADADFHAAGSKAVLLVFHRAGAHGHVREKVRQISVVFRVEHFVSSRESVSFRTLI